MLRCSPALSRAASSAVKAKLAHVPPLKDFLGTIESTEHINEPLSPYLPSSADGAERKVFIETYGCQMNVADSEIVRSILIDARYLMTDDIDEANVVLLNTCAIRDNAENKVWSRLQTLRPLRKRGAIDAVGVLGCMAERLKTRLLETDQLVDVVAGPDAYRDLPRLLNGLASGGNSQINVQLSLDETYADISPVRAASDSISAFVSVARGCNNMCSYCIVPFTRGRERSRPVSSILREVSDLSEQGYKEVVLLGQNVNSYQDWTTPPAPHFVESTELSDGFKKMTKEKDGGVRFAELVDAVSRVNPEMRVRFTSPHPQHFPDSLLRVVRDRPNVCSSIHLPAQSGSSAVLQSMRRGYTRETYLKLVERIREVVPDVTLSSDFITGFCGETEEDHKDTVSLIRAVGFQQAFTFAYSLREKTHAHRRLTDDVPADTKQRRLQEVIEAFRENLEPIGRAQEGTVSLVLVEGASRRSAEDLQGRADNNWRVIVPDVHVPASLTSVPGGDMVRLQPGDYVAVKVVNGGANTLKGTPMGRTTIAEFERMRHHLL